jgi:hypothetical protein
MIRRKLLNETLDQIPALAGVGQHQSESDANPIRSAHFSEEGERGVRLEPEECDRRMEAAREDAWARRPILALRLNSRNN